MLSQNILLTNNLIGDFQEVWMPEVMIEWIWTSFLILPQNVRKVLGAGMPLNETK